MLTFHLNEYSAEKQREILNNILSGIYAAVEMAYSHKGTLFKTSYQIKITRKSAPTVTITGSEIWNIETTLEI